MPSTNTDTVMPTHNARPSAASVSPASGASTDVSGKKLRRHPHRGPADEREHPAPRRPREAVAGGDEQRDRGRHDQAPHHPAGRRRPAVEAQHLRRGRGRAGRRSRATPCRCPRARTRAATGRAAPARRSTRRSRCRTRAASPCARPAIGMATTNASTASTKRPTPGRVERAEERGQHRQPQHPTAPRVVALAEAHDAQEQERQQREEHQRPESTLRDRVAGDRVDPVHEPGRERGPAEPDGEATEAVRTERAERQRDDDGQRLRESGGAEQHGARTRR